MKHFTLLILMVLYCGKGLALKECKLCDCCKNGLTRCQYHDLNGTCWDGCIDGYYGPRCSHACDNHMPNCLACTSQYSCTKCEEGYFGISCYRCPDTCISCSNQYECQECKDGYYSGKYQDKNNNHYFNNCPHLCKEHCNTCSSYTTCTSCNKGFYSGKKYVNSFADYKDCRHRCYKNCKSCSSHYTCEECKNGFYTETYQVENGIWLSNCNKPCNSTCNTCTSGTKCTSCQVQHYLDNGYCYKCNSNCTSCTSIETCDLCVEGKYNSQYFDCRESCKPECKSCLSIDKCIACVPGRYGTGCEQNCSHGCSHGYCDKHSGHCSCKDGFWGGKCDNCDIGNYGTNCDQTCPNGCQTKICNRFGICHQCKTGFIGDKCDNCEHGKYGPNCTIDCPIGCANNHCTNIGNCYSCVMGKYGINCICSYGCDSKRCSTNGDCSSCKEGFTGNKCENCIDGYFGEQCDQNCPKTCSVCNSTTNCLACIEKHWGKTCKPCPERCLNCFTNSECSSCDIGFYGPTCNEKCKDNCFQRSCNQSNGNCKGGCNEGFYGNTCDISCSPNCIESTCDREYGACSKGCKTGYSGMMCNESNLGVTIGTSAGGIILILMSIGVVIVALLVKRRRRNRQANKNDDGIKSENETMTYIEINDIDVTVERKYNGPIRTNTENMVHSSTNDELMAANDQDMDDLYAKPIKPKRKAQVIKSANSSSTGVTVNNSNYEKPEYQTVKKTKENKPVISSKHIQIEDNNAIRKFIAITETTSGINGENDAALEMEVSLEENSCKAANPDYADTYYNVGALKKRKIKLDQLSDFVAKKTNKDFADEFQTLPAMLIKPYVDSQKRANLSKNRYKGIYPYDDTRVVLKDGDSDYINASYIDGYNKNKAYIASIGPTTKYMGDMSAFWIMVWQENVGKIVMLTKLSEVGVPKCDKYWPDNDSSVTFANILVTCKSEEEYSDYTLRSFIIQKGPISRKIVQVHFTAWPDKGTPDDVTSLIYFREKVNNSKSDINGPIIVHCSAGIGRTGTYIALDSVTKEGEAEGEVDIFAFVRNMREQRVNMIQTAEQYQYLHNAIVHTLTFDSKAIQASKFGEYMKLHSNDHLGKRFEKLQASVEKRSDDEKEAVKRNKALKNKNRDSVDIPGDRNRPRLYMYMSGKPGSSDYINALYVNSFKIVNRYLIAQTPLPDTVEDFLTLIIQEKISCIISMEDNSSVGKNIGIFCPADNQFLRKGAFTVKTERENGTDNYLLRKMNISHNSKSGSEDVTFPHIQFTRWGNDELTPEDPLQFVQFVREMGLKFCGDDSRRPILVHCSTGAVRSGLFCVVSTLLEKTQIDQEISVVNTVRQIKYRRHMAIPNKEQYIFCHQCVNEFVSTFDTYSNFELQK